MKSASPRASFSSLLAGASGLAGRLPRLMVQARRAASLLAGGEHGRRAPGTGEKFWQFRDYAPGDAPRDIDWRASARGDDVLVREKEWQTHHAFLFWCQGDRGMDYRSRRTLPSKRERAALIALALAMAAQNRHDLIGGLGPAVAAGRGDAVLSALGETFLVQRQAALPDADATGVNRNAHIFMIGDFLTPPAETERVLAVLAERTRHGFLVQCLDPAEHALSFSGHTLFVAPGEDRRFRISDVAAIRDDYRRRIGEHIDAVRALCHARGWHYRLHLTDEDPHALLRALWPVLQENARS